MTTRRAAHFLDAARVARREADYGQRWLYLIEVRSPCVNTILKVCTPRGVELATVT